MSFLIVVEGGGPVGTSFPKKCSTDRPDLQIESTKNLGNGVPSSCPSPTPGFNPGVPGFPTPDFGPSAEVTIALQEFASRFVPLQGSASACTKDNGGNDSFVNPASTLQFCGEISTGTVFPPGDTILTVQLRDSSPAKNIGPTAQIVVRVPTLPPTPTPPPTLTPTSVPTLTPTPVPTLTPT